MVFDVTRNAVVTVIAILLSRVEISTELYALLLWIRSSMFVTYVVEQIFGGRTLVVAVTMLIETAVGNTFSLIPRRSLETVALVICRMKGAVELLVVAETAGLFRRVRCRIESADVGARRRRVGRVDVRVALEIGVIATRSVVLRSVVVARLVRHIVNAVQFFALLFSIHRGSENITSVLVCCHFHGSHFATSSMLTFSYRGSVFNAKSKLFTKYAI